MKVGIVTFHRAHNCGAALQCAALVEVIQRMKHDVWVIDNNTVGETHWPVFKGIKSLRSFAGWIVALIGSIGIAEIFYSRYKKFHSKLIPLLPHKSYYKDKESFDIAMVGSDQVFNPSITGTQTGAFLLEDIKYPIRKCCYASSFGTSSLPESWRARFSAALSKFDYLTFRESSADRIVHDELKLNKKTKTVLDPTLLLCADDYEKIEQPVNIKGQFVVVYCDSCCQNEARYIAACIAKRLNIRYVYIDQYRRTRFKKAKDSLISVSPQEFVWLMRNAEYVVTTSFHGTVFSLINRKGFIVIRPRNNAMNERTFNLLGQLELMNQVVFDDSLPCVDSLKMLEVDYNLIDQKLSALREESKMALVEMLSH